MFLDFHGVRGSYRFRDTESHKKKSEKKMDHKCPVLRVKNEILAFWAFEGKFTSKTVLRGVATFTNTPR